VVSDVAAAVAVVVMATVLQPLSDDVELVTLLATPVEVEVVATPVSKVDDVPLVVGSRLE
jgi:hypothetical protein